MTGQANTCAEIIQRSDHDRYLTTLYAREGDRLGLTALYALNVELSRIPSLVSEPMLAEIRFAWWRDAFEELTQGKIRHHPVIEALAPIIQQKNLDIALFQRMINARIEDLYNEGPYDLEILKEYGKETAGLVFTLALRIVDETGDWQEFSASSGVFWALIGALHGLAFQVDTRGMEAVEAAEQHVYQGEITPAHQEMARKIGAVAQDYLNRAKSASKGLSRRALPVAMPLALGGVDLAYLRSRSFTAGEIQIAHQRLRKNWVLFRAALSGRL